MHTTPTHSRTAPSWDQAAGESSTQAPAARTLSDLASPGARPVTTQELARMVGMSATFIRSEIRNGHLRAVLIGRGRKRVFRIRPQEARRYAKELGLL